MKVPCLYCSTFSNRVPGPVTSHLILSCLELRLHLPSVYFGYATVDTDPNALWQGGEARDEVPTGAIGQQRLSGAPVDGGTAKLGRGIVRQRHLKSTTL